MSLLEKEFARRDADGVETRPETRLVWSLEGLTTSDKHALRIRFGMTDKQPTDWSGNLVLNEGKVESIRGWRWAAGDSADGDTFTVATRRPQAQSLRKASNPGRRAGTCRRHERLG